MGAANTTDLISQSAFGEELDRQDCEVLGEVAEARDLAEGEVLFRDGETDESVHIVISGKLAVTKTTGGGDETTLHVLHEGDLAGEMGFIDATPHSATVKALTRARVVSLQRGKFESLISAHPQVVYDVMRAIVRRVHATMRRMNFQYIEMTNYITKTHGRY
ncbi:MAG: cyclic nucleotide-binding domain-containing protein [Chromatiales bacterium]|jgi:CRP-like cAMP-binding protein